MKRFLLLMLLFSSVFPAFSGNPGISEMRTYFFSSINDEDSARLFLDKMNSHPCETALALGYKGASKTFMARHSWNPYDKLSHLKAGMQLINQAIDKVHNDAELRFIRLSITYYLPGILGYGEHQEADKKLVLRELTQGNGLEKPERVQRVIVNFLLESELCNREEKATLRTLI